MVWGRARLARSAVALAVGTAVSLMAGSASAAYGGLFETDFFVFYESGLAWRTGADLYDTAKAFPNLNPPHFVVAFSPFTLLTPHVALAVWLVLNVGAGAWAAVLVWRELALPRTFVSIGLAVALTGLMTGTQFGLEEGQPIGVFALVLTAAWSAARRDDHRLAGLLLGLLVSVKPFFGCLLIVPLLNRQRAVLTWAAAAGMSALGAGVLFAGVDSYVRWLEVGRQVSWFTYPLNASLMGMVARTGLAWPVWFVLSAAVFGTTAMAIWKSDRADIAWLVSGLASLLISPLGWAYYLPLLAGPLVALGRSHPGMLMAGIGFLWPMPLLMVLAPANRWSAVLVFSIPFWSMLALWAAGIHASLAPKRMA
jgi:hypothetical protein